MTLGTQPFTHRFCLVLSGLLETAGPETAGNQCPQEEVRRLGDPMDYTVHGVLQAGILEWVAYPFSRGFSQPRDQTGVSCIAGRFFTS